MCRWQRSRRLPSWPTILVAIGSNFAESESAAVVPKCARRKGSNIYVWAVFSYQELRGKQIRAPWFSMTRTKRYKPFFSFCPVPLPTVVYEA